MRGCTMRALVVAVVVASLFLGNPTWNGVSDVSDVGVGTRRLPSSGVREESDRSGGGLVGGIDMSELDVQMTAGCEEGQECEVTPARREGMGWMGRGRLGIFSNSQTLPRGAGAGEGAGADNHSLRGWARTWCRWIPPRSDATASRRSPPPRSSSRAAGAGPGERVAAGAGPGVAAGAGPGRHERGRGQGRE